MIPEVNRPYDPQQPKKSGPQKRRARIRKKGANTCSSRKLLPIFFVPGVMGSHLKKGWRTIWNPDGDFTSQPAMAARQVFATALEKHRLFRTGVVVRNKNWFGSLFDSDRWGEVSTSFYGKVLEELADKSNWCLIDPRVYAVGYAWCYSNKRSAKRLDRQIRTFLKKHEKKMNDQGQKDRYVLVSHSMGALVARSFAVNYPATAAKCTLAVHGVPPHNGATKLFGFTFSGSREHGAHLADNLLRNIQGKTPLAVRLSMAAMPGVLQLAPNNAFTTDLAQPWLRWRGGGETHPPGWRFSGQQKPKAQQRDVFADYLDPLSPVYLGVVELARIWVPNYLAGGAIPGRWGTLAAGGTFRVGPFAGSTLKGVDWSPYDKRIQKGVETARAFHAQISGVVFPRFVNLCSTGLHTDRDVVLVTNFKGTKRRMYVGGKAAMQDVMTLNVENRITPGFGDGTVPIESQKAYSHLQDKCLDTHVTQGVEHAEYYNQCHPILIKMIKAYGLPETSKPRLTVSKALAKPAAKKESGKSRKKTAKKSSAK